MSAALPRSDNMVGGMRPSMDDMARHARRASALMKAMAHENRLLLLCLLSEGERSVGELEALLSLRQSAVSQQLARLRLDGLVSARRDGKTVFYSIADDDARRLIAVVHDIFCKRAVTGA
jgi:DNA-binding transcriptional ArsR family regulator